MKENALFSQDKNGISENEVQKGGLNATTYSFSKVPASRPSRALSSISWTSPVALVTFLGIFIVMIAMTILLRVLSQSRNGFVLSSSTNPYTYKYGPTAVLTLVVALWRQVDNATRYNAPWLEMSKGFTIGQRGVLLDYVSPILPSALWSATRNRHWRVVTTIFVFGLLKLAILFSTGLLVPHQISATTAVSSIALKPLSGASGNSDTKSSSFSYYSDRLYANVVSNLTFPPGITLEAAFQEMSDIRDFPPESVVTAQVLGFFPSLKCEEVAINVSYGLSYIVDGSGEHNDPLELSFQSPRCSGSLLPHQPSCSYASWTNCDFDSTYLSWTSSAYCEAFDDGQNYPDQENALVFALLKMAKDRGSQGTGESKVLWTSGLLCETLYSVETADLTVDTEYPYYPGGKTLSQPTSRTGEQIAGYAPSNLTADFAVEMNYFSQPDSFLKIVPATYAKFDYSNLDFMFQLMLTVTSDFDVEKLHDTAALTESTNKMFKALSVQFVGPWLSFPDHLTTNGTFISPGQKLFVQLSATWEMCVVLGVATLAVIILIIFAGPDLEHPDSLSELAASATEDRNLVGLLSSMGHKTDKQLNDLSHLKFAICRDSHGAPRLLSDNNQVPNHENQEEGSSSQCHITEWWTPLSATRWFAMICVLIPIIEIAVLETLQRKSDADDGICDTNLSLETANVLVSLIPASIMLITAALYSSARFNVGVASPYHLMKKKPPRLLQVNRNPAGDLPAFALFRCLTRGYYAAVTMIVATTIGTFLTIIVSGLYAVNGISRLEETTLFTTTQFNPSWNQASDNFTNYFFPLVHQYGLSYPSGTFETFAYPNIQLDESDPDVARILRSSNATTLDLTMPVTRASLDCSLIPQSEIYYGPGTVYSMLPDGTKFPLPGVGFLATHPLPDTCQLSTGIWKDSTNLIASANFSDDIDYTWALPLYVTPESGKLDSENYPADCPSIAFSIGHYLNDTSNSGKTIYVCTQIQEELPALLRFKIPGFSLDPTFRPQLDELQARKISGYQYYEPGSLFTTSDFYTDWVAEIVGLSLDDMQGPDNAERFLNATQEVYRMIMALTIGDAMRVEASELNSTNTVSAVTQAGSEFTGTIINHNILRISQNKTPKIILQALLSAMLACFIAAYPLVDTRRTLPHNPCSVAGTLTLLLGSNFSRKIQQVDEEGDAHGRDDKRLLNKRVTLGWWEGSEGRPARFGVDIFDDGTELKPNDPR